MDKLWGNAGSTTAPMKFTGYNITLMEPGSFQPLTDEHTARLPGAGQLLSGPVFEQEILQWYFHNQGIRAHTVCTDQFIEKSKEAYCIEWLAREIPQNFVDHNPVSPGTLNGVDFKEEVIDGGGIRFTTTGQWAFSDATALLSLHSEKPEGQKSAGGNGIGIKQAALLLLRDYGVDRFEIQGDGWNVNYRILTANEINRALEEAGQSEHSARNNWLVGEFTVAPSRQGENAYVIETNHPQLIENLRQMPLLGVSDSHPALQDLDYKSGAGSIKYVLPDAEGKLNRGLLFLNGQIMNAHDKGSSGKDYWHGPYGLTIQLNQIDYEMSMDRPPITVSQFRNYVGDLVDQMTREELIDQLRRSEPLWSVIESSDEPDSRHDYSPEFHFECHSLLAKVATTLRWSQDGYTYDNFRSDFPDRKYVARDSGNPSDSQMEQLREGGYTLLPRYFNNLGVPLVSSIFKKAESLPANVAESRLKMAKSSGIEVSFEQLNDSSVAGLANLLHQMGAFEIKFDDLEASLVIPISIDGELLAHPLPNPKTPDQRKLHQLRGIIFHLLEGEIAHEVTTDHARYSSTYALGRDSTLDEVILQTRISDGHGEHDQISLKIQMSPGLARELSMALIGKSEASKQQSDSNSREEDSEGKQRVRSKRNLKSALVAGGSVAVVAGLVIGVPALVKKIDWSGLNLGFNPGKSRPFGSGQGGLPGGRGESMKAPPRTNYSQLSRRFEINSTKSYDDILAQNDHTNIRSGSFREESSGFDSNSPDDPEMDYNVILNPTPAQLERLRILLTYFELSTNLEVRNNLFIYQGDGSKGVNIGGDALGINVKIIDSEFDEALTTWAHEVAHNRSMNHGLAWETMRSSLDAALRRKQAEVIQKQRDGVRLTPQEAFIRDARDAWNAAR